MTALLDQVETRLAEVEGLLAVAGAASFAALMDGKVRPAKTPSAWVIPVAERAGPPARATQVAHQRITVRFGIVIAVREISDAVGDKASAAIEPVHLAVVDALVGWRPEGHDSLVAYAGGRIVGFQTGFAWWLAEYETARFHRGTN
ncbi:MAG: hypothetical protein AB7N54_20215 [Alphaproteobacteria bacterium]